MVTQNLNEAVGTVGAFRDSFPIETFPPNLQELSIKISNAFAINYAPVGLGILTIVSAAIGNNIRISPKEGWQEPPFLWSALFGNSGSGKSPFLTHLLKPIFDSQLESCNKNVDTHYFVSDITVEALFNAMKTNPRGLISYQDELSGFIKSHDQYKSKGNDRQKYIELWNCQPWKKDRICSGSEYIHNTGCSIIGGIQSLTLPSVFKVDSIYDGLLPRFLFGNVLSKPYSRQAIANSDMEVWNGMIAKFYSISLTQDNKGRNKYRILYLTDEAHDLFESFHNQCKDEKAKELQVFMPKLISYSLRLAGILSLMHGEFETISLTRITQAIKLIDYFKDQVKEVLLLYGNIRNRYSETEWKLIDALKNTESKVKHGKLPLEILTQELNSKLSPNCKQTNQQVAYMLKKFGLMTKESGGYSYLIWEPKSIYRL